MDYARYDLGDFVTAGGERLPGASLAYRTYGAQNAARDNCIVLPSYYTGTHRSYAPMIGPGRALDPERWFIVAPNAFGNGLSSSPSHSPDGVFPLITLADNVRAQHQLVFERLGVRRVALACGWSMGAMQAYAWAALYPDEVERLLPWCGSAQCWPLNRVFLEGLLRALDADPDPAKKAGLRAFGRSYAGWAYSAGFYREEAWRRLGFASLEEFLVWWEDDHVGWDVRDLVAMLETWRSAEPGRLLPAADLASYLGRIQARTVVMPCDQDAYFTLAENEIEAALIPNARLEVIRSDFGHCAGAPGREPAAAAQIEAAIARLLSE
jgi:homoserine O-acetyltransferase